ncbi:hypothetical protein LGK95_02345 [Clostridium algoriphilum]|uniref:hypothetical protein n=1 Tax=Clostridium algoriphilum TaxID=198347 RepID=UPI001CF113CE|nr:hypothetical protein [Clostridium algoriphilum]MCB2292379.1 hypothetical protein [Clostridium algoriphilum]
MKNKYIYKENAEKGEKMGVYTTKLIDLFMDGKNWTRADTLNAYDYLHGAFYENEININIKECEPSKISWGIIHLCDILKGEGMYGSNGVQDEIRNSILAVMENLNVITKGQYKSITDYLYKYY